MPKYQRKFTTVDAIQWKGDNKTDISFFLGRPFEDILQRNEELAIPTSEGIKVLKEGDYIVKTVSGEIYVIGQKLFESRYELVED